MAEREKIGIFGGTFNPVHFGHLRSAEEVREQLSLDKIIFVPSYNPPLKSTELAPFRHRIAMTATAIRGNPFFSVSGIEAKIPGKSYTIYTIRELKRLYPNADLFFIMGTDAFTDLPSWFRPEDILAETDIVVIFRPPLDVEKVVKSPFLRTADKKRFPYAGLKRKLTLRPSTGKGRIIFLMTTPLDISATRIRRLFLRGRSAKYLLPQKVELYIISNKLFIKEP